MKKILLTSIIFATAFVASASSASAMTIVNGQPVFGYVSGYKPAPGPEQAFVGDTVYAPSIITDVVGNTRIYDFIKDIKSSDIDTFLAIVRRAGIHY